MTLLSYTGGFIGRLLLRWKFVSENSTWLWRKLLGLGPERFIDLIASKENSEREPVLFVRLCCAMPENSDGNHGMCEQYERCYYCSLQNPVSPGFAL